MHFFTQNHGEKERKMWNCTVTSETDQNWKPNRKKKNCNEPKLNIVLKKVDYKSYFSFNFVINQET